MTTERKSAVGQRVLCNRLVYAVKRSYHRLVANLKTKRTRGWSGMQIMIAVDKQHIHMRALLAPGKKCFHNTRRMTCACVNQVAKNHQPSRTGGMNHSTEPIEIALRDACRHRDACLQKSVWLAQMQVCDKEGCLGAPKERTLGKQGQLLIANDDLVCHVAAIIVRDSDIVRFHLQFGNHAAHTLLPVFAAHLLRTQPVGKEWEGERRQIARFNHA